MVTLELLSARPRDAAQMSELLDTGWPAFISADRHAEQHIATVRERFTDFELVALQADDTPVAAGWAVPLAWDSTLEDLPSGYSDSLRRAVEGDRPANTLVICAAQVHHKCTGQGLATTLLHGFRELSERFGFEHVIVPLRPTMKAQYPLTPISTYAQWQRSDGLPWDPWLRTHIRMGAHVLQVAPRSQVMTGTVAEWEAWTDMQFPASGEYVIPQGLSTLHIDDEADAGTHVEPNIWVQHR